MQQLQCWETGFWSVEAAVQLDLCRMCMSSTLVSADALQCESLCRKIKLCWFVVICSIRKIFCFVSPCLDTGMWSSVTCPLLCSKPCAGHSMINLQTEQGENRNIKCTVLVFGGSDCSGSFYNDTQIFRLEITDKWLYPWGADNWCERKVVYFALFWFELFIMWPQIVYQ